VRRRPAEQQSRRRLTPARTLCCLRAALSLLPLLLAARGAHAEPDGGPVVLDVRAESGVLGRSFRYTDPLADHRADLSGQRPADNVSPGTPVLRLRVESYPLAPFTQAWPASLGLHVDASGGLPTSVRGGPGQATIGTQSQGQLAIGAQMRIRAAALEIVPRVAWGLHGAYVRMTDGSAAPLPDVTYSFLEFGLGLRGRVEMLTIEGQFGLRPGLSAGEVASAEWFPNATYLGLVTGAAVGWTFHPALALRLGVEFIQYGLTFNPEVGLSPERVVGGATDQSVAATLGLEWRLASPAAKSQE
jgi:hypothetical protein